MNQNSLYLDLLLYRPKAFILLSYLILSSNECQESSFTFYIKDIKPIGGRVVLTKEQVRANLTLLEERGYIEVKKNIHPYPRACKKITILSREE